MDNEMKNGFGVYGVSNYFDDLEYDSTLLSVYVTEEEANAVATGLTVGGEYVGYEVMAVQS